MLKWPSRRRGGAIRETVGWMVEWYRRYREELPDTPFDDFLEYAIYWRNEAMSYTDKQQELLRTTRGYIFTAHRDSCCESGKLYLFTRNLVLIESEARWDAGMLKLLNEDVEKEFRSRGIDWRAEVEGTDERRC